jgi:hypothetical protein
MVSCRPAAVFAQVQALVSQDQFDETATRIRYRPFTGVIITRLPDV